MLLQATVVDNFLILYNYFMDENFSAGCLFWDLHYLLGPIYQYSKPTHKQRASDQQKIVLKNKSQTFSFL